MNAHAEIRPVGLSRLAEENEELRETVRQLREALVPMIPLPRAWRLTKTEELLIRTLRAAGGSVVHHERAMIALYGTWEDAPQQKILDVLICKCRRKLMEAQARISIETVWGRGWRMSRTGIDAFDTAVAAESQLISLPSSFASREGRR